MIPPLTDAERASLATLLVEQPAPTWHVILSESIAAVDVLVVELRLRGRA